MKTHGMRGAMTASHDTHDGLRVSVLVAAGDGPGRLAERSGVKGEDETARAQGSQGQEEISATSQARFRETTVGDNEIARRVLNAAIEVHRHLGPGYLESVYQAALEIELGLRGVRFERQVTFLVAYKGQDVGAGRVDLLAEGRLIVEIKAVEHLTDVHTAQALSYLQATGLSLALLINLKVPVLLRGVKRVARNQPLKAHGKVFDSHEDQG